MGIAGKVCLLETRLLINAAGASKTLAAVLVPPPRCPLKPKGSPRSPSQPAETRSLLCRTRSKTLYYACLIRLQTPYKGSNRKIGEARLHDSEMAAGESFPDG